MILFCHWAVIPQERVRVVQPGQNKAQEKAYYTLSIFEGGPITKDGKRLFTRAYSDRTRGNSFPLQECKFRLNIRKISFIMRVMKQWNRFSREVVGASPLGSAPGQVARGFKQPGLEVGVPAHDRGSGSRWSTKVSSDLSHSRVLYTQNNLSTALQITEQPPCTFHDTFEQRQVGKGGSPLQP